MLTAIKRQTRIGVPGLSKGAIDLTTYRRLDLLKKRVPFFWPIPFQLNLELWAPEQPCHGLC